MTVRFQANAPPVETESRENDRTSRRNRDGVGRWPDGDDLAQLYAVKEIDRALRMGGSGEDRALVLAEDLEPMREVRGVVFARLRRDPEIRAQERGAQLGDELFAGVARVAEALAAEVAVEAAGTLGPVRELVSFRGG